MGVPRSRGVERHEQPRQMFTTLLNWGRYGDVFGYSRDTDLFFLHRPETPST